MDQDALERRDDLFSRWALRDWFSETDRRDPDFEDNLRSVWVMLFTNLYDDLDDHLQNGPHPAGTDPKIRRDKLFLEFTNVLFPTAVDNYKWMASEKRGQDIGLLSALDMMATEDWYIELLARFSQTY